MKCNHIPNSTQLGCRCVEMGDGGRGSGSGGKRGGFRVSLYQMHCICSRRQRRHGLERQNVLPAIKM